MILLLLLAACVFVVAAIAILQAVPIERLAYITVGVFVLFVTWNGLRVAGGGMANLFMVAAFMVVPLYVIQTRRAVPFPPWLFAAAAGFVIAAMVAYVFPPEQDLLSRSLISFRTEYQSVEPLGYLVPRSDLYTLLKFETALLLIPLLIAAVATTKERIERLMDLFVLSATINAAVSIVDFLGVPIAPYATVAGRASGLTIHPNYLALTCTVGIPLAVWWISRGGPWRLRGLIATTLLLGGTYASGSRAGAVTAVLGLVLTVAALPSLRRSLRYVLPVGALLLIPVAIFTPVGAEILDQVRLGGNNTSGSDTARSHLADIAMDQFRAEPIQGVGMGVIQDAHNIYLQLLAAGGLIAAASFLTYVLGLANSVRRAFRGPLRDPAVAAGLSVLMWLVNGRYDAQLADKYLYVVPGFLVAIGYVATVSVRSAERPPSPKSAEPEPLQATPSLAGVR